MKRDSSKTILVLSVIILLIIAITLIVTMNKYGVLTGKSTSDDTAAANLTISAQASLRFTDAECNFGSGAVDEEALFAIVYSNGTVINESSGVGDSWGGCTDGLTVQNDGDVDLSVTFSSSADKDTFITSSTDRHTASFKWKSTNDSTCTSAGDIDSYSEITAATPTTACANLTWAEESGAGGTLQLDFKLEIPEDALGTKGSIITATGTSI